MCSFFFYFGFVRQTLSANELRYTSPENTYSFFEAREWTFVTSATFILVKQQIREIDNKKKTQSKLEFVTGESRCVPSQIILHGAAQPPVIISQLCHCRRCLVASGAPPQLSPSRGKAGRQLRPFSSWPVGQYVWNVSGVFGHSGVGAGRE